MPRLNRPDSNDPRDLEMSLQEHIDSATTAHPVVVKAINYIAATLGIGSFLGLVNLAVGVLSALWLSDGLTFGQEISTTLPSATTLLNTYLWMSAGGTSSTVGVALLNMYIETDT